MHQCLKRKPLGRLFVLILTQSRLRWPQALNQVFCHTITELLMQVDTVKLCVLLL